MQSPEIEACLDVVIDRGVEAVQVMGARDRGEATGVMFVKMFDVWDVGRFMLKLSDVKFRGHQIKAQYASKDFPMERMHMVRNGMLGNNRVVSERQCQRIVTRRREESRMDQYGSEVCNQFDHGMRLE